VPSPRRASENGLANPFLQAHFNSMDELVFEVTQEADGGFVAEALGESIFTQADTWEELRTQVREAVAAFHFDRPAPSRVRLHLVRDEVLA
jgi:predicted RNase H-like HicB family nuclease